MPWLLFCCLSPFLLKDFCSALEFCVRVNIIVWFSKMKDCRTEKILPSICALCLVKVYLLFYDLERRQVLWLKKVLFPLVAGKKKDKTTTRCGRRNKNM